MRSRYVVLMTLAGAALVASPSNGVAQENVLAYELVEDWAQHPRGVSVWGQTIGVELDAEDYLWIFHRCWANICIGEQADQPSVARYDMSGRPVRQWGEGIFVWPHGLTIDQDGNLWLTDAMGREGIGHQVFKFTPDGELLMTLGQKGVAGATRDTFNGPADVAIADDGSIFVADGHGNNRVVKLDADGRFVMEWGTAGTEPGQFDEPHTIAIDRRGRVFVGDRRNQRIQVFDQEGNFLDQWTNVMASGMVITPDDRVYVADYQLREGIVVADAETLEEIGIIKGTLAEGVAVDADGNVYTGEVAGRDFLKFVPTGGSDRR